MIRVWQEMAEMYVGDDVSPDFYGWVFPKYDHVGVGTGTVLNRPAIKDYQVRHGMVWYDMVYPSSYVYGVELLHWSWCSIGIFTCR